MKQVIIVFETIFYSFSSVPFEMFFTAIQLVMFRVLIFYAPICWYWFACVTYCIGSIFWGVKFCESVKSEV